ncbi:transposase [Streptomyces sp. NBC_01233]|uniref:transposase n=1 Tax=Streptomyces sp. NBC_01233 TaxID=2903787 RepID=UPI003FA3659F
MLHTGEIWICDAVALYRSSPGATIGSVATDLGVNTETLRYWIRAADGRLEPRRALTSDLVFCESGQMPRGLPAVAGHALHAGGQQGQGRAPTSRPSPAPDEGAATRRRCCH